MCGAVEGSWRGDVNVGWGDDASFSADGSMMMSDAIFERS